MLFTISKSTINQALGLVSRAIGINSPLPALSGIKIEVTQNELILTGSDADLSIKKIIPILDEKAGLSIEEEGSVVLEARYLTDIVRKIDSDVVKFELLDGALTRISGANATFNLNGMKASSYPQIDFETPELIINMKSDKLAQIIDQTLFATSDKETRPVLTGINFNYDLDKLVVIATDSYRLARKVLKLDSPIEKAFNVTIPRKALGEISKIVGDHEDMTIAISNKKVQFLNDHNVIQSRLLDGLYPETSRLIPTSYVTEMKINSRDMLNAIDRASFIKSDGISIVRLNMTSDKVDCSSRSQEVGSSLEILNPLSFEGNDLKLSFSGKFMTDAVRSLNSNEVLIQFSGDMKPFVITNPTDDSILQLVLPVRTYD